MAKHDSGSWLKTVIVGARDAGWCMSPYCTTCGCLEFRRAYWAAAVQQAGLEARFESARHPRGFLNERSGAEREAIVRALVAGLRQLPPQWIAAEAFRTIIIDLDPPLVKHAVPISLDTELSATPAGEGLARMRAHAQRVRAESGHRQAYESPQAVEQRKRVKREQKARSHALRESQTRKKNAERLELLAALACLPVGERLSRFAADPALKLDSVSPELIPARESDLVGLDVEEAVALAARIGGRKGAWGRLRRIIDHRLKTEPD